MKIELWNEFVPSTCFLVIVEHPTGIIYTNQTHGLCCAHPQIEGFMLPPLTKLYEKADEIQQKLYEREYLRPDDANHLDSVFEKEVPFRVDGDFVFANFNEADPYKGDSGEAWIRIKFVEPGPGEDVVSYRGLTGKKGVLTWTNSD